MFLTIFDQGQDTIDTKVRADLTISFFNLFFIYVLRMEIVSFYYLPHRTRGTRPRPTYPL